MKKIILCLFITLLISGCTHTDYSITYIVGNDTLTADATNLAERLTFKYEDVHTKVSTKVVGRVRGNGGVILNTLMLHDAMFTYTICASTDPIHVIEIEPVIDKE